MGQMGQEWESIQDIPSPPPLPLQALCGAGGVLLRTGEGRCQISDKVIFTLGVEAGR